MVHMNDIMNPDLLSRMWEEGYVRRQHHPSLPLIIWNYTEKAQFDKRWNEATINCRGLITDLDGNIVARPWKKFFNYGEGRLKIDDEMPVEVTDKMDGSLGILYPVRETRRKWNGGNPIEFEDVEWKIATRGSFASDQAIHGTRIWGDKYADWLEVPEEFTFLFEIIYPENRIVLNYGEMDDLVLLGAVHNERGYYLGPNEAAGYLDWRGPVTQVFPYRNIAEAFAAPNRKNAEGFVVRSGTEIVKIKQVDYIELHRIVTNLTPLSLWRRLAAGESFDSLLETIPDEWHEWLKKEYTYLADAYQEVEDRVFAQWAQVQNEFHAEVQRRTLQKDFGLEAERKNWARIIAKKSDKKYLFKLLDSKPIDDLVWAEIRPRSTDAEIS